MMASVVKRRRKDGSIMFYGKIKTSAGSWTMLPTHQPSRALAARWATARCGCPRCGGPENARRAEEAAMPKPPPTPTKMCGELMDAWEKTLTNTSADSDRSRLARHVRPAFARMRPDDITLAVVMKWIDQQRSQLVKPEVRRGRRTKTAGRMSDATIRHNLNLLSRFFAWTVARGYAAVNPVRMIPTGARPKQSPKDQNAPWIDDEKTVRNIMHALSPPYSLMFYLGNRAGLRPCETRGLRMSDLDFVSEGQICVRYSDDRPYLKEDKLKAGKAKWAPAPADFDAVMGGWMAKRRGEGAQPEDYVFGADLSRTALEQRMLDAFKEAVDALGLEIGQYQATRHSMISRNLRAGAPVDEVARAVGHSTPQTTLRHYDHLVRPVFRAPSLRAGIGATEPASAKVISIAK